MTSTRFQDDPSRCHAQPRIELFRDAGSWRFVPFGTQPGAVGNSGLWTTTGDLLRWADNLANPRVGSARTLLATCRSGIRCRRPTERAFGLGIRNRRTSRRELHRPRRRRQRHRQLFRVVPAAPARDCRAVQHRRHGIAADHAAHCGLVYSCSTRQNRRPQTPPHLPPAIRLSNEQLESKAGLYREAGSDTFFRSFVRDGRAQGRARHRNRRELRAHAGQRGALHASPERLSPSSSPPRGRRARRRCAASTGKR